MVAKASVIGNSHIKEELLCQDSYAYEFFPDDDFAIAVVSDGAGSAEFSHIASQQVVNQAMDEFSKIVKSEKLNLIKPSDDIWQKQAIETFKIISQSIKKFSETENLNFKSLGATAIVMIIVPYGLLTAHIGDGRAGYLNGNGLWNSCMTPFKGELANETVFITSDFWEEKKLDRFIECRVIEDSVEAFTLLSDGCENTCFQLNQFNDETKLYQRMNNPYAGFYNPNIEVLKTLHNHGLSEKEIDSIWRDFLANGIESFASEPDDKTLLLGVRINNAK